jgi:hypothetical protein
VKRPSFATAIAFTALFVALGGPAQATRAVKSALGKGSVNSRAVKDRSLKVRDLSRPAVRSLQTTPNGSVTGAKLAAGSVGAAALAARSVTAPDLAVGAVHGEHVADGSLRAVDFARFSGRFRTQIGPIPVGKCWSGEPAGLAPEVAGADISTDLILISPDDRWLERRLTFSVRASANHSRFVIAACNLGIPLDETTLAPVTQREVSFSYAVIDV